VKLQKLADMINNGKLPKEKGAKVTAADLEDLIS
jgi:hypothetical protein